MHQAPSSPCPVRFHNHAPSPSCTVCSHHRVAPSYITTVRRSFRAFSRTFKRAHSYTHTQIHANCRCSLVWLHKRLFLCNANCIRISYCNLKSVLCMQTREIRIRSPSALLTSVSWAFVSLGGKKHYSRCSRMKHSVVVSAGVRDVKVVSQCPGPTYPTPINSSLPGGLRIVKWYQI